jgi:hypothetical protein
MLKLMHRINKYFTVLNKYFYILPLLSILSNLKNNKYFKIVNSFIKLILIMNIVLGVSLIIYFTDLSNPMYNTYSFYYDLIEPYIEMVNHIWNKIINYFNNILSITPGNNSIKNELESVLRESSSHIKSEVKAGMNEAISEALSKMQEDEITSNSDLVKQLALFTSTLFGIYFLFILPGSTEGVDLTQYNWFNQSLIEIKTSVKDFVINLFNNKPSGPSPMNSPVIIDTNLPKVMVDAANSPISPISPGISTITPNTPTLARNLVLQSIGTQTQLNGIQVSRAIVTTATIHETLPENSSNGLKECVNSVINNITD